MKEFLDVLEKIFFIVYGILSCGFIGIFCWIATDDWD